MDELSRRAVIGLMALASGSSPGAVPEDQDVRGEYVNELIQLSLAQARISAARESLGAVPAAIDAAPDERSGAWACDINDVDGELETLQSEIGDRAEEIMDAMGVEGA